MHLLWSTNQQFSFLTIKAWSNQMKTYNEHSQNEFLAYTIFQIVNRARLGKLNIHFPLEHRRLLTHQVTCFKSVRDISASSSIELFCWIPAQHTRACLQTHYATWQIGKYFFCIEGHHTLEFYSRRNREIEKCLFKSKKLIIEFSNNLCLTCLCLTYIFEKIFFIPNLTNAHK